MVQYQEIVLKLKSKEVLFDRGMSLTEIEETEKLYDISFPVELKCLYSVGLPVSKVFIIGVTQVRRTFNELRIY